MPSISQQFQGWLGQPEQITEQDTARQKIAKLRKPYEARLDDMGSLDPFHDIYGELIKMARVFRNEREAQEFCNVSPLIVEKTVMIEQVLDILTVLFYEMNEEMMKWFECKKPGNKALLNHYFGSRKMLEGIHYGNLQSIDPEIKEKLVKLLALMKKKKQERLDKLLSK